MGRWAQLDTGGDWAASWARLLPGAVALVSVAQVAHANASAALVAQQIEASGGGGVPAGDVSPYAFAGWMEPDSSDYAVPLDQALSTAPVVAARMASGSADIMLAAGAQMLGALVQQAVAHAGRQAASVTITSRPKAYGAFWDSPCCQRCSVLVGKKLAWDTDFRRHPRCNGVVVGVGEYGTVDFPEPGVEDITDLTHDQLHAINDGADINQVINAKSSVNSEGHTKLFDHGMKTFNTRTRKRGNAKGFGANGVARLTPKGIYRIAGDDREKAVALLREHGYIVGQPYPRPWVMPTNGPRRPPTI